MLTGNLARFDRRRLQFLLAIFFLALAAPTAFLVWQAYGQLKWEAVHRYRGVAEELTGRIDARLDAWIRAQDAYSFADYAFLIVSGDPSAKFVQRSPLSDYPVAADLPGVLGYFQVDSAGDYTTPLLPPAATPPASVGIDEGEYAARRKLAGDIREILADNRLVEPRPKPAAMRVAKAADPEIKAEYESEADEGRVEAYSQTMFDRLSADEALDKKSEEAARADDRDQAAAGALMSSPARAKRLEQTALPEVAVAGEAVANIDGSADLRISTFESEVDPLEFSLLGSGHIVLFRKVWRDNERYIQGLLLDREVFARNVFDAPFTVTALAGMSKLVVAYRNGAIHSAGGREETAVADVAAELDGEPLYRSRLSAPFDGLELVYDIERLPLGPGARLLAWVTLAIVIVLAAGFVTLYRTGLGQIELARQQQDFVSAVSHELKSPLTSIRMYGEMLKEGWADDAKRQSYYEFIHDEAERLSRLIANVLQLARITRNEPQFDIRPIDVNSLITNIESKVASQVERAGFALVLEVSGGAASASIDIDDDCFAQIVINLVDNAIKFSRNSDNKTVEIAGKPTGDGRFRFSVRDYGPGIPKDQLKKIFRLFYRSESELTRETVGTGIGLAIVHQLTRAMGGSVDVVNADPGAEFRLWFPLAGPAS